MADCVEENSITTAEPDNLNQVWLNTTGFFVVDLLTFFCFVKYKRSSVPSHIYIFD